ncbi:hypothetical protein ACOZ4L_11195 [Haloplanus ruber]|uniref:CopG family transcriptional regulator n=1 Tax=Haloplanus ruber TaxID=869892 RepID=A0ABD6CTU5_9EURY
MDRSGRSATDRHVSSSALTSRHLEAALAAEEDAEKNYHIRSALQRMMIAGEARSGRQR